MVEKPIATPANQPPARFIARTLRLPFVRFPKERKGPAEGLDEPIIPCDTQRPQSSPAVLSVSSATRSEVRHISPAPFPLPCRPARPQVQRENRSAPWPAAGARRRLENRP